MPYSVLERGVYGDHYALIWETKALQELGASLHLLYSEMASFVVSKGLVGRSTVLFHHVMNSLSCHLAIYDITSINVGNQWTTLDNEINVCTWILQSMG